MGEKHGTKRFFSLVLDLTEKTLMYSNKAARNAEHFDKKIEILARSISSIYSPSHLTTLKSNLTNQEAVHGDPPSAAITSRTREADPTAQICNMERETARHGRSPTKKSEKSKPSTGSKPKAGGEPEGFESAIARLKDMALNEHYLSSGVMKIMHICHPINCDAQSNASPHQSNNPFKPPPSALPSSPHISTITVPHPADVHSFFLAHLNTAHLLNTFHLLHSRHIKS